jgi:hypothetical protein
MSSLAQPEATGNKKKRPPCLVAVSSRSPRLILFSGERNFAARLTERETKASEAKQHHGPSRRFGNRRNGESADAEPLGSPLAIGIAACDLSWSEKAEDIIKIPLDIIKGNALRIEQACAVVVGEQ